MGVTAAMAVSLAIVPSASADQRRVFRPAEAGEKTVTFKVRGVAPRKVVRAAIVRGAHRRQLSLRVARRAARYGSLRVRRTSAKRPPRLAIVSDTRAPRTVLSSGPPFSFGSSESGSSFECRLDDGDWHGCASPVALFSADAGNHTFYVRAIDAAGNTDRTPASHSWTVEAAPATGAEEPPAAEEPPSDDAPATGQPTVPVTPPTGTVSTPGPADSLFFDGFTGADSVITNHYAYWSPNDRSAFRSPDWEMESGCVLRQGNTLWSGVPSAGTPNRDCSNGTGSEILRLWTKRASYGDVQVTFDLRNNGYVAGAEGERSWDGIKVFLRRTDRDNLYTAEVNRRQGNVLIQKKCGGEYTLLGQGRPAGSAASIGEWEKVGGVVRNLPDGSVQIEVIRHGKTVLSAIDSGGSCGPLTRPGQVGIRSDYTNWNADDFLVTPAS